MKHQRYSTVLYLLLVVKACNLHAALINLSMSTASVRLIIGIAIIPWLEQHAVIERGVGECCYTVPHILKVDYSFSTVSSHCGS